MNKPSFTDRLRYGFDNTMSKGTIALIAWLAVLSGATVFVVALIVVIAGIAPQGVERLTLTEAVWLSLMRTLDPGTMGGDEGWGFRIAMLAVTVGGIFIISTFIGVLTAGIEGKLESLRKGRSTVIETGHTVILGWSPQVFTIISELVTANENQPHSCIVILGDRDKVEMEDEIRDQVEDTGRTRIVCRRGNPMEMTDLEIVSLHTAKSIIVLSPEDDDPDSGVIKTLLAITNNPNRRPEPYHVVAEIHDLKNLEVARIIGRDEAELVSTGELIARITAQTCRQSGLSVVYTELMDFAGDEIYFQAEPELVGRTFGEALLAYEDSAVMGLRPRGSKPKLNPPMDTRIQEGDEIIAISADDDTVILSGLADLGINAGAIRAAQPVEPAPEQILVLGWNWRTPIIINELNHYVPPGSTVTVVADCDDGEALIARCCDEAENLGVTFQHGDTTDRRTLDTLPFETTDHVILVSYSDTLDPQRADARTLVTLLHLRDIADHLKRPFSIVSEILNVQNRELAEVTRADDFVVSDKLVSLILSQISENKALGDVFTDLFDPDGSEIYLKPAGDYVALGERLSFYTVVDAARQRGEVALGYRVHADAQNAAKSYGVVANPDKSNPITFAEKDRIIVLAEY